MKLKFRHFHILQFFDEYEANKGPLDKALHYYFRAHKSLGSKDRAEISSQIYQMTRQLGLIDFLLKDTSQSWANRYDLFLRLDEELKKHPNLPDHIQVSCPEFLFNKLKDQYGLELAKKISLANNLEAPVTLRANLHKISRESLLNELPEQLEAKPTLKSSSGITLARRSNLFELPAFKNGYFEIQDEGSQILASLVQAKPGDQIMDYCAGSGGKTLAIAPSLEEKGQLYLHDIRSNALAESKKRLKRAGVQNAQILRYDSTAKSRLRKKMDWIIVDAPCSGSGTLRRNPDMKWRFSEDYLKDFIGKQRFIFEQALSYLKPGGKIVYCTCSILAEENEMQVEHFLKSYDLSKVGPSFHSLPEKGRMDGFFGIVLQRTNS